MSFWLFVIRAEIARLSVPGSLHKEEETGTIFLPAFLGCGLRGHFFQPLYVAVVCFLNLGFLMTILSYWLKASRSL